MYPVRVGLTRRLESLGSRPTGYRYNATQTRKITQGLNNYVAQTFTARAGSGEKGICGYMYTQTGALKVLHEQGQL